MCRLGPDSRQQALCQGHGLRLQLGKTEEGKLLLRIDSSSAGSEQNRPHALRTDLSRSPQVAPSSANSNERQCADTAAARAPQGSAHCPPLLAPSQTQQRHKDSSLHNYTKNKY
uniref:Uncharacterized protein n=1 Tax=Knipowitschia caucasica TaxID=637954 RepID=A0AAV2K0N7_KNICA